jgi:D-threo-aldose 1-dehydrogenase
VIELGELGLGTAPLAGLYEEVDAETAHAVVDRAWELGVRFFDTAPFYGSGLAERRLGEALRSRPRDEFVLSTKVGRLLRPGESGWHGAPKLKAYFDFSYDGVLRSLEASLERLGVDRVDVALVHDPDRHHDEAIAGAFPALERLRDEGVVRAIGAGMNQTEMLCRFAREADPDCFLVAGRYTLLDRSAADELLPLCVDRGIAVIAGGVFNSGVLAGGDTYDYAPASPEVVARARGLDEACARLGVPLAAAAVQFPGRHPAVASVLVGCASPAEVEEDVRLSKLEVPEALWDAVA